MNSIHRYTATAATAPPTAGWSLGGFYMPSLLFSFLSGVLLSILFARAAPRAARNVSKAVNAAAAYKSSEPLKMVLVVRKDLKMTTGKIAAQCSHAAVDVIDVIQDALADSQHHLAAGKNLGDPSAAAAGAPKPFTSKEVEWGIWLDAWRALGRAKIALKCDSETELLKIYTDAKAAGLPTTIIQDAGHTQIAAGSRTVVAVGPAPQSKVDGVTGELKLL